MRGISDFERIGLNLQKLSHFYCFEDLAMKLRKPAKGTASAVARLARTCAD